MKRTQAQHEKIANQVEDLMLRGIERPGSLVRLVEDLGDPRTAKRYIASVHDRWRKSVADTELARRSLIQRAMEIERRGYQLVAQAANAEPPKLGVQAQALRVALLAQERQAKLLGLDTLRIDGAIGYDAEELQRATLALLGVDGDNGRRETLVAERPDAIAELYGARRPAVTG
jgi:hypothetical protein